MSQLKVNLHQYGSRSNRAGETVDMHLQGFQPDFILFLEDSNFYFQIFIAPKGMSGDRFDILGNLFDKNKFMQLIYEDNFDAANELKNTA